MSFATAPGYPANVGAAGVDTFGFTLNGGGVETEFDRPSGDTTVHSVTNVASGSGSKTLQVCNRSY